MRKLRKILGYIIMIIAIIVLIVVYNKYDFNNFDKSVRLKGATNFIRDNEVKYSKQKSYEIENKDYNDAMFSQTISVMPHTPYKLTCMVKTEGIENQDATTLGGAHICLNETQERSELITGTNDWQELTFMFNSKNETELNIGFRLGGYENLSKGKVWFSDFKLEVGVESDSNKWKMVCFIFPDIDVNVDVNGKAEHVKLQMTDNDINTIKTNLSRFKNSIKEISKDKIEIEYDTYVINEPIRTLSYDKENYYYVSGQDIKEYIDQYIEKNVYDHIYVAFRMADKQEGNSVLVNDWIGLGGMVYSGIGFSNIRMPDDRNNIVYEFNYRVNTFPEEVFIHEFLHTLERNAKEYGYDRPDLHDYAKYGYSDNSNQGLKEWYTDYINKQINYNGTKVGLPEEILTAKPVHKSDFKYATEVEIFKQPNNIIEVIQSIIKRIQKLFSYKPTIKNEINTIEETVNNESFGL